MVSFEDFAVGNTSKILFIGGGNMATAIIEGSCKSGFLKPEHVAVTTRSQASAEKWLRKGFIHVSTDNSKLINKLKTCIIVLAIKPHFRHDVFKDLASANLQYVPLVISLMAGIHTTVLQQELSGIGYYRGILRVMPNTPCSVQEGATLLAKNPEVSTELAQVTKKLAESVGLCVEVDERVYNGAAAISGCGPAWVFMFIESLADGGVLAGVPRQEALQLAAQTVLGAAKLVLETNDHPGVLKDKVCSPAGTTIAGLRKLEENGFRSAIIEAVKASAERADSM